MHVPITDSLIDQLYRRRCDLIATNLDRADALEDAKSDRAKATIRTLITIDRLAVRALDRVVDEYVRAADA